MENLVAEADGAVAKTTEEAKVEKAPASRSGSEADDRYVYVYRTTPGRKVILKK